MRVRYTPEAEEELLGVPAKERQAIVSAVEKLKSQGDQLSAPHSSSVKGVRGTLRELRPRGGRSPWRAFYRRIGNEMVIGSIGPEAEADRRGFRRAAAVALERLNLIVAEGAGNGTHD